MIKTTAASRLCAILYWTLPSLLCLALYWYSLKTWFAYDDFVWLGLRAGITGGHDLWTALFAPAVHGTVRPLSERAFFLIFHALFGFDALPYRIWIFLTFFADLVLVCSITLRLTGSRLAGFCAPFFWFSNAVMFTAMGWTSAYMQILCAFFLLLAFHFLLRFEETGLSRYYWWQWVFFLIGFGAMETNVVYPALAASYALLRAPALLRKIWPMFVPSILFAAAHMMLVPKQAAGPYSIHVDPGMAVIFWKYWSAALKSPWGVAPLIVWTLALLGFVAYQAWRRNFLPLVFLSWFAILLAPVLPLRDHVSDYYLTLPLSGLSMLAAYGLAHAWKCSGLWKVSAAALAAAYFVAAAPAARGGSRWLLQRSRDARTLVMGVKKAHELHPGKTILLTGVDNALYWAGLCDRPFRALGIPNVYLAAGSEGAIQEDPAQLSDYVLPLELAVGALDRDQIEVYSVGPDRLRNVTGEYARAAASKVVGKYPRRVDVANQAAANLVGSGWYPVEGEHRWMKQRATLKVGGPVSTAGKLRVKGYCTPAQLEAGPLTMRLSVDGRPLPPVPIRDCSRQFEFGFDLPAESAGREALEISVEVNRITRLPGDPTEYGLAFGVFEIR